MYIPRWMVAAFLLLLVTSNLVWLQYLWQGMDEEQPSIVQAPQSPGNQPDSATVVASEHMAVDEYDDALNAWIDAVEAAQLADSQTDSQTGAASSPADGQASSRHRTEKPGQVPPDVATAPAIPFGDEASQAVWLEHDTARDFYHSFSLEEKRAGIDRLSASGQDLELIRNILQLEDNAALRAMAVSRLAATDSFGATNTLIEALDDPAIEVQFAALQTLAGNGDRSVLGLLERKLAATAAGTLREQYEASIRQLAMSASMTMDGH